jgi:hypothetical protein
LPVALSRIVEQLRHGGLEVEPEVQGRGEAPIRRLFQGPHHDLLEAGRERWAEGERRRRVEDVRPHERQVGVGLEGHAPRQHLVENHAQRVEIAAAVDVEPLDLLRRHVGGRPHREARARAPIAAEEAGDAEVHDLRRAVRCDDDVGRLDVAVDHPLTVCLVERIQNAGAQTRGLPRREGTGAGQPRLQRLARHELHDHE